MIKKHKLLIAGAIFCLPGGLIALSVLAAHDPEIKNIIKKVTNKFKKS